MALTILNHGKPHYDLMAFLMALYSISFLGCPTDWIQSNVNSNQCYRLYNNSLSWNSALYTCQNSTLTSLISVDNAFENGAINNYINTTYKNCHKVYIGLQKMGDTWEWTNGDNSKYRNWETSKYCNLKN